MKIEVVSQEDHTYVEVEDVLDYLESYSKDLDDMAGEVTGSARLAFEFAAGEFREAARDLRLRLND